MSSQASVRSIDALKSLRAAMALYGEDALAALGAVDAEVRRAMVWLEQDRPRFWQEQIKRRREQVASARAEVFRRKLGQTSGYPAAMSEQVENLRRAEAGLREAESRLNAVRKWQPRLKQAALEYRASTRRLRTIASGDVPRAVAVLGRMIDALEAYVSLAPPAEAGREMLSSSSTAGAYEAVVAPILDADRTADPVPEPDDDDPGWEDESQPITGQVETREVEDPLM